MLGMNYIIKSREIEKQNYKIIIKDKRSQSVKNSTSKKEKL